MISRNSRKVTGSVEQLRQGSFTMAKGIDETAPALNTDAMLHIKNLDIDSDGGLILRKPLKAQRTFPKVGSKAPDYVIPFQNNYTLLIYVEYSRRILGIVDSENNAIPIDLEWVAYDTFIDKSVDSVNLQKCTSDEISGLSSGEFYIFEFLTFENPTYANLVTTLLVYGVLVNYTNSVFNNTLADSALYTDTVNVFRALQITYNKEKSRAILKIAYTELSEINFGTDLPLDANLSLDNPYAMRDKYAQSLNTVKGILPYVPTSKVQGEVINEITYADESVEDSYTNRFEAFPSVPEDTFDALYSAYLNGLDLDQYKPTYLLSTNPSELSVGFKKDGNAEYPADAKIMRSGTLSFKLPSAGLDIGYLKDTTNKYVSYNSTTGDLNVLDTSYHVETFSPLCKVSSKAEDVDIIKATSSGLCISKFDRQNVRFNIPLDIKFYDSSMEEYFTKDTLFKGTLSDGTAVSAHLPQVISDFLNPNVWMVNNNATLCKNIIPLCIALTCGFQQYPNDRPRNPLFEKWTKEYLEATASYISFGRVFIDANVRTFYNEHHTFIILTRGTISKTTSVVQLGDTVILKIPVIPKGFSINTLFTLQSGNFKTLEYTSGFDQSSYLHDGIT